MKKPLYVIVGTFVIIMISCLVFYGFYVWLGNGYYRPTLPDSLVVIADDLLDSSASRPLFIRDIQPFEGSTISSKENVCVTVHPTGLVDDATIDSDKLNALGDISAATTRIRVNGQRLARNQVDVSVVHILDRLNDGRLTARHRACFQLNWQDGLHLIELSTSPSFLGLIDLGSSHTYQWVYVVDSTE